MRLSVSKKVFVLNQILCCNLVAGEKGKQSFFCASFVGLQHCKLYVFDNSVLISGANLSQDYFTNR